MSEEKITIEQSKYIYECVDCGWSGKHSEKRESKADPEYEIYDLVCPECGCDSFFETVYKSNLNIKP